MSSYTELITSDRFKTLLSLLNSYLKQALIDNNY